MPEAFAFEMEERIVWSVFIVIFPGYLEEGTKDLEQEAVVFDAVLGELAGFSQEADRQQHDGFMRSRTTAGTVAVQMRKSVFVLCKFAHGLLSDLARRVRGHLLHG